MRPRTGRVRWLLAGVAAVVTLGGIGVTLGAVHAREREVFVLPPGAPPVVALAQEPRAVADSVRVRRLLDAARGANAILCDLVASTVDGRSGWYSDFDTDFRAGATDSLARDVVSWVQHREVDATAVALLREALTDSDRCVRRLAAPMLGRVEDPSAMQAMLSALTSSDAGVREVGALALGFADDPRSIPPLVERLRDDSPRVRATAAWALGEMEHRDVVRPLVGALADTDPMVRQSAARALGEVEDASAVPPLTDLLKSDRDPAVRRAVAWALGEILG